MEKIKRLDTCRHQINDGETNLVNFSFVDHKSIYESLLFTTKHHALIRDRNDFWKFVNKYEHMLKSVGKCILQKPLIDSSYYELKPYHKLKCVPLQFDSVQTDVVNQNNIQNIREQQFREIILIYLNFKQKEKFIKIKKMKINQRSLLIWKFKEKLKQAIEEEQVLIIAGDTGCGKSTQIPQYLYEFGYRCIACTQPRRLACISLSKRVAHEMLDDYGTKVGFQIRFEKNRTIHTNILFITEGLLLRQLALESNLDQYDVLILDEIHERNLFGDFLLGVTKCLLRAKPKLKLILMSATINVELFYSFFKDEGARLLEIPGRLHPIKTMYMPPPSVELQLRKNTRLQSNNRLDPAPYIQVLNIIDQKYSVQERGDVLIFVSGVNEITTLCDAIKEYSEQQQHWIILPLHSGLSLAEQDKVFDYAADGMRKCIVSTNIAETSLTIDGIRFVIDSGKVKEMSYDAVCKGQRLKEFWVSKSSAEQRRGRAGRTGPGTCFRLFSEKQYATFEAFPTPEVFRVPLDTILLQMIVMGLPNVRQFPFIESPEQEHIEQTILNLKLHNALTANEKVTNLGRSLSNLPVEISIGKMLLMGCVFPDMDKILTLSAVMSVQNPFTNRAYSDPKCEEARNSLESDHGDIFILMNAYHEWLQLKYRRENTRKWCYKLGIEEQRFYEITKLRNQFENILESNNMVKNKSTNEQLSSSGRARRHGELRMLRAIKRKHRHEEPRRRKILKHSDVLEEDLTHKGDDVRDVDFRLQNNETKLQILLNSSNVSRASDVLLIKLIIISGFYPQIAIADEFNYCKGGSQQFFHTNLKPFISLHPNGYFAKFYEILKLNDSDIMEKPNYYTPKTIFSETHQILCYQQLLETAKPYLMNCIRLPAVQALLLFSYSIDTNISITRVVCDTWLCLEFPIPATGCDFLLQAIKLRLKWEKILMDKLADLNLNVENQSYNQKLIKQQMGSSEIDRELWQDLLDFLSARIAFTIKRLLPADQKSLYTHRPLDNIKTKFKANPFASDFDMIPNEEKGGVNVCENVVYGCLENPEWCQRMEVELEKQSWTCGQCKRVTTLNTMTILTHKIRCEKRKISNEKEKSTNQFINPNLTLSSNKNDKYILFHCTNCDKELKLSQIDILKHKKICR